MGTGRRGFFKLLAGVAVLAVTDPLKLIPAVEAAPGAAAATALAPIIELPLPASPSPVPLEPFAWRPDVSSSLLRNRALMSKKLRQAAIAETKFLHFWRLGERWPDLIRITPPEERHGA